MIALPRQQNATELLTNATLKKPIETSISFVQCRRLETTLRHARFILSQGSGGSNRRYQEPHQARVAAIFNKLNYNNHIDYILELISKIGPGGAATTQGTALTGAAVKPKQGGGRH